MKHVPYEEAVKFAIKAHEGQERIGGDPYYTHPLRVAKSVPIGFGPLEFYTALLHDVLEDTEVPESEILETFGPEVLEAVISVTRRYYGPEVYADFIKRSAEHPVGRVVKYLDILDNSRPEGLITEKLKAIAKGRYMKARKVLEESFTVGQKVRLRTS